LDVIDDGAFNAPERKLEPDPEPEDDFFAEDKDDQQFELPPKIEQPTIKTASQSAGKFFTSTPLQERELPVMRQTNTLLQAPTPKRNNFELVKEMKATQMSGRMQMAKQNPIVELSDQQSERKTPANQLPADMSFDDDYGFNFNPNQPI
jgi:hypothetical protein